VATNDVHYTEAAEAEAQDVLLCIQTGSTVNESDRLRMGSSEFYLKSEEEMSELFADVPEALSNSEAIAERCMLELKFGKTHFPHFDVPEGYSPDSYLRKLCEEGLIKRYSEVTAEHTERLNYELSVIEKMGYAPYFLIVQDFVAFARSRGIISNVRGSAPGSLVAYCCGITDVDPMAFGLIFERFLNLDRVTLPDIDVDFMDNRRDEVISYVVNKYGQDRVAQIITFGTMLARQAIRDVGRALGMPYGEVDRVAKLIPFHSSIDEAITMVPELRELVETQDYIQRLVFLAQKLEGVVRHASTHAAGIVISRDPLTQIVPLQKATKGEGVMTQFEMHSLQEVGLLKMDFLGLANLTILVMAREIIRQRRGIDVDIENLPDGDPETFNLLGSGETTGIFQFESAGMRRYLKELRPTSVLDLMAMVALFRPGPMNNIPTYIKRKHGQEPIDYLHPSLEKVLKPTYGVMVYQEDVMKVANVLAGYPMGAADLLCYAIRKKKEKQMRKHRQRFIAGAETNGVSQQIAEQIFRAIEPFAGYGFCQAHAASYARVAYQTAYLKAHYPLEYMTAVLSSERGNPEKVAQAVAECRRMNIPVLPPDINESELDFSIQGEGIRFALAAIKNVGESALEGVIANRSREGKFKSLHDFCSRIDVGALNKRVMESLIKAGAFDSLGERGTHLANLDIAIKWGQQVQRDKSQGQASLFQLLGEEGQTLAPPEAVVPLASRQQKSAWEKELLGLYLSDHPLGGIAEQLKEQVSHYTDELSEELEGQRVSLGGVITSLRRVTTKRNEIMLVAQLEDLAGSIEVIVFPKVYQATSREWEADRIVVVQGRIDFKDEKAKVLCDSVAPLQAGPRTSPEVDTTEETRPLHIRLLSTPQTSQVTEVLREVRLVIEDFEGDQRVILHLPDSRGGFRSILTDCQARDCEEFRAELQKLAGNRGLEIEIKEAI